MWAKIAAIVVCVCAMLVSVGVYCFTNQPKTTPSEERMQEPINQPADSIAPADEKVSSNAVVSEQVAATNDVADQPVDHEQHEPKITYRIRIERGVRYTDTLVDGVVTFTKMQRNRPKRTLRTA